MNSPKSTERRSYQEGQIGFYFALGNAQLDADNEAEFAVHSKAYDKISTAVQQLPCWRRPEPEFGPDGWMNPYELCEMSYDTTEIQGCVGFSVWFHSHEHFKPEDIVALKAEVERIYAAQAQEVGMSCKYLQTQFYKVWRVTETGVLPEGN